jgi:hypothetical protein
MTWANDSMLVNPSSVNYKDFMGGYRDCILDNK